MRRLFFVIGLLACGDPDAGADDGDDGPPPPVDPVPCAGPSDCAAAEACVIAFTPAAIAPVCGSPVGASEAGALCRDDGDCRAGLCHQGACVDLCGAGCAAGACETTGVEREGGIHEVGLCVTRAAAPSVELGPIATPLGGSGQIPIDVPAGTASFTIILSDAEGLRVAATRLESPTGAVVIDASSPDADANPTVSYIGTASIYVPISDLVTAEPGRWNLEIGTFDPTNFADLDPRAGEVERVSVVFEPEGEEGGALDLVLGFPPAFSITASTATSTEYVQQILGRISDLLVMQAKLQMGVVRFVEIGMEHETVEDGDETRTICRTYSEPGPHGTAVNVFVVGDLTYTSGHAGGIPGPPGRYGTNASCIVAEDLGGGGRTGILLAHEIGHFLGLKHTTELSGAHDPISDTPECPSGTAIEDCPDYRNLMFPQFPLRGDLRLTEQQIDVIGRNPILYE